MICGPARRDCAEHNGRRGQFIRNLQGGRSRSAKCLCQVHRWLCPCRRPFLGQWLFLGRADRLWQCFHWRFSTWSHQVSALSLFASQTSYLSTLRRIECSAHAQERGSAVSLRLTCSAEASETNHVCPQLPQGSVILTPTRSGSA